MPGDLCESLDCDVGPLTDPLTEADSTGRCNRTRYDFGKLLFDGRATFGEGGLQIVFGP